MRGPSPSMEGVCPGTLRSMRQVSEVLTVIFLQASAFIQKLEGLSSEQSTLLRRVISL